MLQEDVIVEICNGKEEKVIGFQLGHLYKVYGYKHIVMCVQTRNSGAGYSDEDYRKILIRLDNGQAYDTSAVVEASTLSQCQATDVTHLYCLTRKDV